MKNTDYSSYAEAPASDKLATLSQLAQEQNRLEGEVAELERQLKAKQEELTDVSERTIPALMDELNMKSFTTREGFYIEVAEAIRASIPKARLEEAVAWLDKHGFQNLVKRKFTVLFGKNDEKVAQQLAAELRKRYSQFETEQESSVHSRTLAAFVKEQLEAGKDLPLDLFGVFRQRFAKLHVK